MKPVASQVKQALVRNPTPLWLQPYKWRSRPLLPQIGRPSIPGLQQSCHSCPQSLRLQRRQHLTAVAALSVSAPKLLPATTHWGIFAGLALAGGIGIWSENTQIGKELSGPLVSTLVGLLLSNCGAIPCESPAVYGLVNRYLLPLAVPLLLFSADLRRMLRETGRLLMIFCVGSVATVIGTLLAFKMLPLTSLGADGWKVASALAARHIGGAVNYVGVAQTLGISCSAQAAGLAADNLLCAVYFATLFNLARNIGPDDSLPSTTGIEDGQPAAPNRRVRASIGVEEGAMAVGIASLICYVGTQCAAAMGIPDAGIPMITLISVALATAAPRLLTPLIDAGEGIAAILLAVFFAGVGANGNVAAVVSKAPALFLFCFLQIGVHLGIILTAGRFLGFSRRDVLLASNANVGGPTTAGGMAAAKGWKSSLVPALLVGTFGYAIATFIAVALGVGVLQKM